MEHLGTYEAGSDWTFTLTLNDRDGAAVNLKSGGDATLTAFVERNGAIYLNDVSVTIGGDTDGNPVTLPVTDTNSAKLPKGKFDLRIKAVLSDNTVLRWRQTFAIVTGGDV
jgi:hypothetical protein